MRGTDLRIERTAAVQIMVDPIQSCFFQHLRLLFGQESDGTADLRILFLHNTNAFCQVLNLCIRKLDSAQTNAVPCKVLFIHQIIISV